MINYKRIIFNPLDIRCVLFRSYDSKVVKRRQTDTFRKCQRFYELRNEINRITCTTRSLVILKASYRLLEVIDK